MRIIYHQYHSIMTDRTTLTFSDDEISEEPINTTIPWIEKYRPTSLDEIISQNENMNILKTFIKTKSLPHIMLFGPPGTGKTSTIMNCGKKLYGKYVNNMVIELNASDDRGIEVVRNRIKQFIIKSNCFAPDSTPFKLVILDETDAMTPDAQAILRQIIEKYTKSARFCLICNYIENIDPALISRCAKFRFAPLKKVDIVKKVKEIAVKENITISDKAVDTIINRSHGDMRCVLNILQTTSMAYSKINEKEVNLCTGYPTRAHVNTIITSMMNDTYSDAYSKVLQLITANGYNFLDIVNELFSIFHEKVCAGEMTDKNLRILSNLRIIEENLSVDTTVSLQLAGLIGMLKI